MAKAISAHVNEVISQLDKVERLEGEVPYRWAGNLPKDVTRFVLLGLLAGGQKRFRHRSRNSPVFNAEIFDFDGSPGIPSEPDITARDAATHKLLAVDTRNREPAKLPLEEVSLNFVEQRRR